MAYPSDPLAEPKLSACADKARRDTLLESIPEISIPSFSELSDTEWESMVTAKEVVAARPRTLCTTGSSKRPESTQKI
jgi:hypothetical protein